MPFSIASRLEPFEKGVFLVKSCYDLLALRGAQEQEFLGRASFCPRVVFVVGRHGII